ncbi:MAG: hypothetical protein ACAF41_11150 [Leptolyngbya sp. BL-A-14]
MNPYKQLVGAMNRRKHLVATWLLPHKQMIGAVLLSLLVFFSVLWWHHPTYNIGFDPNVNGFKFHNGDVVKAIQNATEQNQKKEVQLEFEDGSLTAEDMIQMFGPDAVCFPGTFIVDNPHTCVLTASALAWRTKQLNSITQEGACEGMAIASLRLFLGQPFKGRSIPAAFQPGATKAVEIDNNRAIQNYIAYYSALQSLDELSEEAKAIRKQSPGEILGLLIESMQKRKEYYTMGVYKVDDTGRLTDGHTLVPTAIKGPMWWNRSYQVAVYDSNSPKTVGYVTFTLKQSQPPATPSSSPTAASPKSSTPKQSQPLATPSSSPTAATPSSSPTAATPSSSPTSEPSDYEWTYTPGGIPDSSITYSGIKGDKIDLLPLSLRDLPKGQYFKFPLRQDSDTVEFNITEGQLQISSEPRESNLEKVDSDNSRIGGLFDSLVQALVDRQNSIKDPETSVPKTGIDLKKLGETNKEIAEIVMRIPSRPGISQAREDIKQVEENYKKQITDALDLQKKTPSIPQLKDSTKYHDSNDHIPDFEEISGKIAEMIVTARNDLKKTSLDEYPTVLEYQTALEKDVKFKKLDQKTANKVKKAFRDRTEELREYIESKTTASIPQDDLVKDFSLDEIAGNNETSSNKEQTTLHEKIVINAITSKSSNPTEKNTSTFFLTGSGFLLSVEDIRPKASVEGIQPKDGSVPSKGLKIHFDKDEQIEVDQNKGNQSDRSLIKSLGIDFVANQDQTFENILLAIDDTKNDDTKNTKRSGYIITLKDLPTGEDITNLTLDLKKRPKDEQFFTLFNGSKHYYDLSKLMMINRIYQNDICRVPMRDSSSPKDQSSSKQLAPTSSSTLRKDGENNVSSSQRSWVLGNPLSMLQKLRPSSRSGKPQPPRKSNQPSTFLKPRHLAPGGTISLNFGLKGKNPKIYFNKVTSGTKLYNNVQLPLECSTQSQASRGTNYDGVKR